MSPTRLCGRFFPLLCLTAACSIASDPRGVQRPVKPPGPAGASPASPLGVGDSYAAAKVGGFLPDGDLEPLDNGFAGELVVGNSILSFLAIEGSIGYLSAEGGQADLWAIPVFANLRASLPISFLEPYAGAGIGGLYANYELGSSSGCDYVPAWDAFLGLEIGLGRVAVGAEVKYLQSGDTDGNFSVEGFCAFLFLSLPF